MSYSSSPRLTAFLCSVLAMGIVDSANAEMCKWVDENGCVHYSETCPEGIKSSNVEIQPPPSRMQVEEANKVFVDTQLQEVEQEKTPSATTEPSRFEIDQMTDRCIKARLSLDALSRKAPIYYDKHGQLQAENYQSVRLDRSSRYLNEDAIKRANEHWILVKKDNCTSAVSGSDVKRAVMQKQKEHQKDQCEFWREELEYIERSRGYHRKHLDLKKLFNANCK
jgi:hypothetical protein